MEGYLTIDLETTTRTKFKRKASPFSEENWVVAAGWEFADGVVRHRYCRTGIGDGLLADLLAARPKVLYGLNIKFDLLHLLHNKPRNYAAWKAWVAEGGMLWDAQLAEYLLEGCAQEHHMLSMDEIAPRYGGNVKVDEVKTLWAAGVQTEDIDPELLLRYLVGGKDEFGVQQLGDIGNTTLICKEQIKRARNAGQLASIMLNMGSLIASTEMELNGVYVDKPLGLTLAADLERKIADLKVKLDAYLPTDLPFQFNWGSGTHRSAVIFGGAVKYPRREYILQDGGATFDPEHPGIQYAMTETAQPALNDDGTLAVYKSGKNAGQPKTKKVKVPDLSKPKSRMGADYYQFPGVTAPKPEWESAKPGVYSTASEVIKELGVRGIPFLSTLSELQAATKDLGTYFITTDSNGESTGMLTLVGDDGIIHHGLNHCSTVTGRFSASSPNLQNIPKGNKSAVKEVFVSRFGGYIIQSDFSALEVYVQAWLTGAKTLLADLHAGKDMHCARLAVKEGMTYEAVYELCKGANYSKEWDYKRTAAKVISFQMSYGAGAVKIAASTGLPVAEVEAFMEAEAKANPEIGAYFTAKADDIKRTRRPTGRAVPHPKFPAIMCNLGRGYSHTPDGKRYSYCESPSPDYLVRKGTYCSFSPTEIKNYEVQGTGAEVMKAAMWLAARAFYERDNFGGRALLVNTVHDAQYVDAAPEVTDSAFATLHSAMAHATEFMRRLFKWDIPINVPSDTSLGPSMAVENKHTVPEELQAEADRLIYSIIRRITKTN